MSPIAGHDDAPATRGECTAAAIGVIVGVLVVVVAFSFMMHVYEQPASAKNVAEFNRVYQTTLTPEQTTPAFAQSDPVTYQLLQNLVSSKLRTFVVQGYEITQKIEDLKKQQRAIMKQSPASSNEVTTLRTRIEALNKEIAESEKHLSDLEKRWNEALRLSFRCRFDGGDETSLDAAISGYKYSLKNQKPPGS